MIKKVIVLALAGLAAWVAIKLPRGLTAKKKIETKQRMKALLMSYDVYCARTHPLACSRLEPFAGDADNATIVTELRHRGLLPADAGEMNERGEWLDAWATPFRVQVIKERCVIDSAGPDRTFGTNDDLKTRRE